MKDARNIEIMITSSTPQDVQKGRCITRPNPSTPRRAFPGAAAATMRRSVPITPALDRLLFQGGMLSL